MYACVRACVCVCERRSAASGYSLETNQGGSSKPPDRARAVMSVPDLCGVLRGCVSPGIVNKSWQKPQETACLTWKNRSRLWRLEPIQGLKLARRASVWRGGWHGVLSPHILPVGTYTRQTLSGGVDERPIGWVTRSPVWRSINWGDLGGVWIGVGRPDKLLLSFHIPVRRLVCVRSVEVFRPAAAYGAADLA